MFGLHPIQAACCRTPFPKNGVVGKVTCCNIRTKKGERYAAARAAGDFDTAAVIAGEVVDLITDIPSAAEIVQRMGTSAARLLAIASNKYRITESQ